MIQHDAHVFDWIIEQICEERALEILRAALEETCQ